MTDEPMNLRAWAENGPDADFLRQIIGFAAERIMEIAVGLETSRERGHSGSGSRDVGVPGPRGRSDPQSDGRLTAERRRGLLALPPN